MTSDVALATDEHASPPIPGHVAVRRAPSSGTVLLVASFGAFLAFLDSTIVNVAFPNIQADFPKASLSTLSWVLNAYNIVLASLMIVAGRLADLVGRRRMFTVGVAIFTIASVLCAAAPSVELLVAYRVVQGVGAALLIPASLALVVQGFEPARRAHGVGLWGAAAAIASGLGPPIGGALVAASSWRLAFLVNLPLGVVAYVIAKRRLVESRSPGTKRMPDLRGAALLGAALGLLTTAVIKGEDWGWLDLRTSGAFVASAVALVGFVLSSRTHRAPLIDPALLRVRSFAVGNLLTVIASVGFYAYLLTHVLYLNKVWDYSLLRAGLAVAPAAFVAAVAASVLGKVADRRGHRSIVLLGALVWAGSLVWYLTQVGPSPAFVSEWLPGQLLQGVGVGATLPLLAGASLARLPKGDGYATASAVNSSARQLGAVLGIAVLVVLIGTPTALTLRDHLQRGWVFAAACFLVVAVGSLVLGRTVHDASDDEPVVRADRIVGDDEEEPAESLLLPAPEPLPDSLADLPLFRGLSPEDLKALDDAAEDVEIDAGTDLFRQGDPGDALYVLRAGRLEVLQGDVVLTELTRGAVLGELALLTGERRSASVRAVRDSRLTRLTADHFARIADLTVMTDLARSLAVRLQEVEPPAESRRRSGDAVIAVVGLEPGSPVEELAATLVEQMARRVTVVDPGRVDRHGLESAEKAAAKVVLQAGVADAEWRDFCLRVADRVVLLAGAAVPTDLPSRAQGADVVLTGRRATGEDLRAWERAVAPRSTHVVPEVTRAATRALAARLTGRSLGLVLGGGGARGFAHVGVLEVLEEAGAQVDRVAGTSMGSVIAAFIASGMDATAVDACSYEYFVRNTPLGDYTLPTRSLIRGRRTDRLLEMAFGEMHIEEFPREFRCVSVDLLNRRRVVHRSGNVAHAVAASLRIPGLFPPVVLDGTVHVDGGVLDNLPVSSLDGSEGPLIAINIGFGGGGSGQVRSRVRVPGLGDTLMRTMMMASGDAAEHAMATADLVIRPSGGGVGLLEWHQIDRMRESGRAAALAALPEIESLISG
ncbi:MAG TPA: DHA2 family efflux MFS transporter permease subunit [Marmoricola sp.]|nr:DHA2 family efflux MFS transporter permease subunit [Marmoricola sp.]